jgi:hypothetical protein
MWNGLVAAQSFYNKGWNVSDSEIALRNARRSKADLTWKANLWALSKKSFENVREGRKY